MKLFEIFRKKKFILFNIFFTLYIGINLIGGERGLISYFDKKYTYQELFEKNERLTIDLVDLDHKISLINNNNADFLDILYRQKFNYVTEDEIIIKLK
jgi:cell division protein DivIC